MKNKCTAIIVMLIMCIAAALPCFAAEKESVKVAYFSLGGYYQGASGNGISSYDKDLLEKVSSVNGMQFEFVDCGTWVNALNMLANHEVDLVGTAQWSQEREQKYSFCHESYGYTVGELASLPDNPITFEDYEAIGKSVIGCTENYVRLEEMEETFKEQNITPIIKYYENQQTLEDAFINGEIDIIAANSHTLYSDWNVVEKFSFTPYYFISWKENSELVQNIDKALTQINLEEPEFDDQLMEKYFPGLLGVPLTKAEMDFTVKCEPITVYFDGNSKPFAWFDEETKSMKGMFTDACEQIKEKTGLDIQVKKASDGGEKSDVELVTLYYDSEEDLSGTEGVTNAFFDIPFNFFYHVDGTYRDNIENCKVGITKRAGFDEYVREKYPNYTFVVYDTPLECIQHLENDDIDCVLMNTYTAKSYITLEDLDDINEVPLKEIYLGFAIRFLGKDKVICADIANKAISQFDENIINNGLLQYSFDTKPEITLTYLIKKNIVLFVVITLLIVVLIVAIISLLLYVCFMRKQRDRIEKFERERSDFFARMSHDMRTPINGVMGMLDLSLYTDDIDEIKTNIEKAQSSNRFLLQLVNDALDLQQTERGKLKLDLKVVEENQVYDSLISNIKCVAKNKKIDFRFKKINCDFDKYIKLDPIRTEEILSNLLTNAIKYTPEGGIVEFTVERLEEKEEKQYFKYTIKDSGIGMSQEFVESKMYLPFMQENSDLLDTVSGSGLGLAIVKNLVDLMNGRIEVDSCQGEGTTFVVCLAFDTVSKEVVYKSEETAKKGEVISKTYDLTGYHILICEDQPLNAEITKKLLIKIGCLVDVAENGKIGLDKFLNSKPGEYAAILMDIRMPVMDGLETTKSIRESNHTDSKNIPIIAVTANAYKSDIVKCMEVGMNGHIAKPINPVSMYSTLCEQIKQQL